MASSAKGKKTKRAGAKARIDRRFLPGSSVDPRALYVALGVGAICFGAAAYTYYTGKAMKPPPGEGYEPLFFWLLAGGAIASAVAMWFAAGSDPATRVGASGIALEKGGIRRVPWYNLERVRWDESAEAIQVTGKDEDDGPYEFSLRAKTHAPAIAWVLREGAERTPSLIDVPEDVRKRFPDPEQNPGTQIKEPLQIVGRRCAVSKRVIAFEPDARVCPACERVYHKTHVPESCTCGADLEKLRASS
jgi:hypothetical protein